MISQKISFFSFSFCLFFVESEYVYSDGSLSGYFKQAGGGGGVRRRFTRQSLVSNFTRRVCASLHKKPSFEI